MSYNLSVIIPALNEENNIVDLINYIINENVNAEIIVSDGNSDDKTASLASSAGAKVITGKKGRARQLNRGAEIASAPILLFLHADSLLEEGALDLLVKKYNGKKDIIGGCFHLEIASQKKLLKFISWTSNLRAKYLNLIFGDQGIFIKRKYYNQIGGFPEIELMEDWEFSKKMAACGKLLYLNKKIFTSARRWEKNGILKTIIFMYKIKILYILGVEPKKLKKIYKDVR